MRFIYCTDVHFRASRPVFRKDDYTNTIFKKFESIFRIAKEQDCEYIFTGGDLFDRADAPYSLTNAVIKLFDSSPVPIYTVIGNHDIFGYDISSLNKTALGCLQESGKITIIKDVQLIDNVMFFPIHCSDNLVPLQDKITHRTIAIAHKLIVPSLIPGVESQYKIDDLRNFGYDLVLCGDYHKPFGKRVDSTIFANPGSLSRMTISDDDIIPSVFVVETESEGKIAIKKIKVDHLKFEEVFDLERYEKTKDNVAIDYAKDLMSAKFTGLNVRQLIRKYADEMKISSDVLNLVLKEVDTNDRV